MPRPVHVVLPLQEDVPALLATVAALVDAWPDDVDGELLVASRLLSADEADQVAELGATVRCSTGLTLGALVQDAVGTLDPDAVVLLAPDLQRAHRAGDLQEHPLLPLACDHRALLALLPLAAATPAPPQPLAPQETTAGLLSVVVVAATDPGLLRTTLEHVRRGNPRLDVVVVDNGAPLEVTTWLAGQRDVVAVRNARPVSAAAARNQGLARVRGDQVVVLDEGTLLPRGWSTQLVIADEDDAVGAVAHGLTGDQHAPTAVYADLRGLQDVAADHRRHDTRLPTGSLSPPLRARTEAVRSAGGWHEALSPELVDDDLSRRLTGLAVRTGVLAHVVPQPSKGSWPTASPRPLLSAALIVKDEQAALPACLASLRGVVDEVVVCDTGSQDGTTAIAEAMGARVVTTTWDDDFAAARNTALAATRGTWVLSIDADEQLHVEDVLALRSALALSSDDALRLPIRSRSQRDDAVGYEHHAARLLRRTAVEWVGAIHEVPVRLGGSGWLTTPPLPGIRLEHDGYLEEVRAARGKTDRNLRLAEKDLARTPAGDPRRWKATYELARTLGVFPDTADRVRLLAQECAELDPPAHFRGGALVLLSGALLTLGLTEEAERAARAALAASPEVVTTTLALGTVLEAQGRGPEALAVLRSWTPNGTDPLKEQLLAGTIHRLTPDPVERAQELLGQGRVQEAAAALEGLDVEALSPEDLLVAVAVAAAVGDRDTAAWLLSRAGPLPPAVAEHADEIARVLGLPGRVHQVTSSA